MLLNDDRKIGYAGSSQTTYNNNSSFSDEIKERVLYEAFMNLDREILETF